MFFRSVYVFFILVCFYCLCLLLFFLQNQQSTSTHIIRLFNTNIESFIKAITIMEVYRLFFHGCVIWTFSQDDVLEQVLLQSKHKLNKIAKVQLLIEQNE